MTARQQWGTVLGVVFLLAGGMLAATQYLGDELFPVTIGSRAPDFAARTLAPPLRTKGLADYEGQVVLLNIWATWCLPCREEMPSIQALHEEFAPKGLRVVAVSIDDAGAAQKIREFTREYRLTFDILHDDQGAIQREYQTTGVPETFVIGADGVILKKVVGAAPWNSSANRTLIAQLLGVAAPALDVPLGATVAPSTLGPRPPAAK